MPGPKLLHSVQLTNLLSYGNQGTNLQLDALNVLIGPNAGGKSNLVEALSLLSAAPRDLASRIRQGGGAPEWIWKGNAAASTAEVVAILHEPKILYRLAFTSIASRFHLVAENLTEADQSQSYYLMGRGEPFIVAGDEIIKIRLNELDLEQSILSQRKDPDRYPELTSVGTQFGRMRFYRDWDLQILRQPGRIDLPDDFLLPDGSNLGLILNDLQNQPPVKQLILEKLSLLFERVEDVRVVIRGGTLQVFFYEKGLQEPIPAVRLSDGTLRYLCLLTILCHPDPAPLICIEEPELGLHPDAIATVADLLLAASARTQLIITTHSDALVSALSEVPEAIVVCERDEGGTSLRRLELARLTEWLERYRLGELWRMGEIGGTRW